MSMRETSAAAYAENLENGVITDLRLLVYKAVAAAPHETANEISRRPEFASYQIDSVRPRFAELERVGVLAASGERKDRHTDMLAITWRITSYVASKADFEKAKPRVFWGVKVEGSSGTFFTNKKAAQDYHAQRPGEFIKLREVK